MADAAHSIVVFGATSFVGRLTCRYLAGRYRGLNWAIAGRSRSRLEALRAELGVVDLPIIVADANHPDSLGRLCVQARVVVSTVGPYAVYGESLVAACARAGSHYCDLTGEVHWIRRMISKYEDTARGSGARIVHCCGFDSLPSDLGTLFIQNAARERFDAPLARVKMRVKAARGGLSGGTATSMTQLAKDIRTRPGLRKELADPYSLCPPGKRPAVRQPRVRTAQYDPDTKAWIAPFIMATTNEHIVHRSNAVGDWRYGVAFCYDEAVVTGAAALGRLRAYAVTAGLAGFAIGIALAPSRALLEYFVLPRPGTGPSADARAKGFYDIRFYGETADGRKLGARVVGDADPGYGSTSKMLGEAAVCLAKDIPQGECGGGFWTPASLLGQRLIDRLENRAGVHFEIDDLC